jgi:hypothetical protein
MVPAAVLQLSSTQPYPTRGYPVVLLIHRKVLPLYLLTLVTFEGNLTVCHS